MKRHFLFILLLCLAGLNTLKAQSYELMHSFYGNPDLSNSIEMFPTIGGSYYVAGTQKANPTGPTRVLAPRRLNANNFPSNLWKNSSGISAGIPATFTHYGSNNFPSNIYTTINSGIEFGKYYIFKLKNSGFVDSEGILMEFNRKPANREFMDDNLLHATTPNTPVKVVVRISDTLADNQHFYLRYRHSTDPANVFQWVNVNFPTNSRYGTATIPGFAATGTVSYNAISMYRSFASVTDNSYGNDIYEIPVSGTTSGESYTIVSQPEATLTSQFSVNMTGQTVSNEGVYLQIETGKYIAMTNSGNNIYTVSLKTKEGSSYIYRYANGTNLEVVPAACGIGTVYKVREFTASSTTLNPATVCFANCVNNCTASNVTVNVKFRVNMSGQVVGAGGVKLAGSFNGFSATATPMSSIGNNVYEATVPLLATSNVTYKFVNGTDYEIVPASCGVNDGGGNINRSYTVPSADATIAAVCFNACDNSCSSTATTAAIKFRVNMTGQTVGAGGVNLAGTFNSFSPTATPMTNIGNNVYESTVTLNVGSSHTYKFVNGSNYENVPTACGANDGGGNINRTLTVPATATTLNTVCFNACDNSCSATATTAAIKFRVNMTGQTVAASGVFLAGTFNSFSPTATPMTNIGNNVYEATVTLNIGSSHTYKFVNGSNYEIVPAACGANDGGGNINRTLTVPATATTLNTVCFNACDNSCSATATTAAIKFRVNMTGQTVGAGGVNLAGTFNGFSATATPMTNIGNNVYEATVTLNIGSSQTYKFVNGSNYEIVPAACGANDGGGNINRTLTVPAAATTLNTVCFNACDNSCGATATTAAIKFRVNMTTQTVGASGVYLAGTFNGFSATATPMTNIGNNVYEATVTLNIGSDHTYKFVNGSNYENVPAACGANDGSGNINRTLTVPATATTLNTVCFNECANCPATSQVTFAVDMSLYPPTTQGIFLAGNFNGFSTTATPMTNIGNNVYSVSVNLPQNTQQLFKYLRGTEFELINSECGILGSQTVYDRFVDVSTQNATLSTVCWGSCNACGVVSVDANKAEVLSVYPNPSENTIRLSKAIDGSFEMIDLNGRVMMQSINRTSVEEINISALPSGIYLLRVTDKGKTFHVKVAKN